MSKGIDPDNFGDKQAALYEQIKKALEKSPVTTTNATEAPKPGELAEQYRKIKLAERDEMLNGWWELAERYRGVTGKTTSPTEDKSDSGHVSRSGMTELVRLCKENSRDKVQFKIEIEVMAGSYGHVPMVVVLAVVPREVCEAMQVTLNTGCEWDMYKFPLASNVDAAPLGGDARLYGHIPISNIRGFILGVCKSLDVCMFDSTIKSEPESEAKAEPAMVNVSWVYSDYRPVLTPKLWGKFDAS
jgi:hypothetical protein